MAERAGPQPLQFPDDEFRRQRPPPTARRAFQFPPLRQLALPRGITGYMVEQHVLPIASLQLEFEGGTAIDPPGKEGLAGTAMALLGDGTARLDKVAYAEALADVASSISATAGDDTLTIAMASLTKHFDVTFALFAETVRTPGLRATDFERLIARRIESVRQARSSPQSIAGRALGAILYGHAHPFGSVVSEDSLRRITLDDCRRFVATSLVPARARLFAVGDVDEQRLRAHFAELADWTGEPPPAAALPPPAPLPGRIFFVDVPGATQAQVLYLQHGPPRVAPDYFATMLVGAVFGGGFTSRLNMNLRERLGYAYGARAGFSYTRSAGTFVAATQVRADVTHDVVVEIDREVRRMRTADGAPTRDEIEREKTGAMLALPARFATAQAALGQYRGLVYYGLPPDFFETYTDQLARVSEAEVAASAKRHLAPDAAAYLVVGDGATPVTDCGTRVTLREALAALAARGDVGEGGLVVMDVDGRVRE